MIILVCFVRRSVGVTHILCVGIFPSNRNLRNSARDETVISGEVLINCKLMSTFSWQVWRVLLVYLRLLCCASEAIARLNAAAVFYFLMFLSCNFAI